MRVFVYANARHTLPVKTLHTYTHIHIYFRLKYIYVPLIQRMMQESTKV